MTNIENVMEELRAAPRTWLVTGASGFIGSHLVQRLLALGQTVKGFDNFATGYRGNLEEVRAAVGDAEWKGFEFVEGDIRDPAACFKACAGAAVVLHHAALGSVPLSLERPELTHAVNAQGTRNMLDAAQQARATRFVYASSSAVYGDDPSEVKREERIGKPLSPYAASKRENEITALVIAGRSGLGTVGLRYFNVFGPRQDPNGAYAAVIPKWISALVKDEPAIINGDGETSRDFCYVENVVQANLLAATTTNTQALNTVFNVACGERTTLNQLFATLRGLLAREKPSLAQRTPEYRGFRPGDVRHSLADLTRTRALLGYEPTHRLKAGLEAALAWYQRNV